MVLRHLFSPLNNTRLGHLCGPTDAHLRAVEAALGVRISHRHEQFKVEGAKARRTGPWNFCRPCMKYPPARLRPRPCN